MNMRDLDMSIEEGLAASWRKANSLEKKNFDVVASSLVALPKMASANVFDIYSTQDEEEVPLVRKRKSSRRHVGESSQMPSAKKNRASGPPAEGPPAQDTKQHPLEQEVPSSNAPAAKTPSPLAPIEQTQQAGGASTRTELSHRVLRSAKDLLAKILKHDRCKKAMAGTEKMGVNQIINRALNETASAMLTLTTARLRSGASIEQSRAWELKLMEELQAAEVRHAGSWKW
ncbi:uncharacterized protein LOC133801825 [Humulus lupulus]|uniref:uncharacterized protein LOC133801825 n=1 Tax=Humulus lupulus TaxID=3486 RepID=UPI002B409E87|nr:uncharacterized protein LOC133801825 [Humulus lupulus]